MQTLCSKIWVNQFSKWLMTMSSTPTSLPLSKPAPTRLQPQVQITNVFLLLWVCFPVSGLYFVFLNSFLIPVLPKSNETLPKTHGYGKSWFAGWRWQSAFTPSSGACWILSAFLNLILFPAFLPSLQSSAFLVSRYSSLIFCQYILFKVHQVCCDLEGYCICLWTWAMARGSFPDLSRGSFLRWKCFGAPHLEMLMYQMQGSDSRFCGSSKERASWALKSFLQSGREKMKEVTVLRRCQV